MGSNFRLRSSKLLSRRLKFNKLLSKCLVSSEDLLSTHSVGTCSGGFYFKEDFLKGSTLDYSKSEEPKCVVIPPRRNINGLNEKQDEFRES